MNLDFSKIRVVAFDCVHTVFDVSHLSRDDRKAYIDQVRRPEWAPLDVQQSWRDSKPHPDAAEGIDRIGRILVTATCSNWPAWLLAEISNGDAEDGVCWSAIVPMETRRCYKPCHVAYLNVAIVCGVKTEQVLMVTANESAPDIEVARLLGMQAILLDRANKYGGEFPRTIIELAELLGC